ncbi:MAG TPA: hypothetical protein VEO36_11695 [Casimicrobiaceae bacterium]|nr:hypothetical protein [Casimicrobiaceae bacterium]
MTSLRLLCLLLVGMFATPAFGQAAAPPDAVAKPTCTKPGEFPGTLATDRQRQTWQKEYTAYSECMKKFISEQKALAEPYLKAYNAAIDEYNENIKVYNEQIEKARAAK